jgi:hypothetical protein
MNNFQRFEAALQQLGEQTLPMHVEGAPVLYRLTMNADAVKVEGFLPQTASGTEVDVAQDFRKECFWVAAQVNALDDYVQVHDGFDTKLVRLNTPFREHRFEEFLILEDQPVVSLLLH